MIVSLILNEDDPRKQDYNSPWPVVIVPAGWRVADIWRMILPRWPDLPWYGLMADDCWPITPGWSARLIEAAGMRFVAYPNGTNTEFPLMRNVSVTGGDLVRAMGGVFPCADGYKHNYLDCVLDTVARDLGLLRPLEDVIVDHLHWKLAPGIRHDATYARGSADQHEDAARYHQWLGSAARREETERIRRVLD